MNDVIKNLYNVARERKECKVEKSYTCYLFAEGIDKILKKCGEECSEMIIAAKNNDNTELANEICDLIYHVIVMMVEQGVELSEIESILNERHKKIGNLKTFYQTDMNS